MRNPAYGASSRAFTARIGRFSVSLSVSLRSGLPPPSLAQAVGLSVPLRRSLSRRSADVLGGAMCGLPFVFLIAGGL